MSAKDLQRYEQCRGCYNIRRCEKHWGMECARNGGRRIPVMKVPNEQMQRQISKEPVRKVIEEPINTVSQEKRFLGIIPRERLLGGVNA